MRRFDVFGLDTPCMDLNVNLETVPERNQGAMIRALSWQGGGKVSSGLVAAARLGARCAVAGAVGDDLYGNFCREDFARHGIDVSGLILRKDATTHLSIVVSDRKTQSRTILFHPGSTQRAREEEIDWKALEQSAYLFISDASPLSQKAAEVAKACGTGVFIDADYYTDGLPAFLPQIDLFIGSEFVFDALFPQKKEKGLNALEEECRELALRGPGVVLFTFGEKGCVGYTKEEGYFVLPAFEVDAIDTVGAGDVFHGAFLASYLKGKTVKECARAASAVSAIKCTRIGGRAGIPDSAVLERFLKDGYIEYGEIDERVLYYQRGVEHVYDEI